MLCYKRTISLTICHTKIKLFSSSSTSLIDLVSFKSPSKIIQTQQKNMDFNLKQWKEHQHESESDEQQQNKCAKITKHMFLETPNQHQQQQVEVSALPLFVSSTQPNNITATTPTSTPKFPRVGERYSFSTTQWQELELQALIYRHMVAGASVPPELLQLVKKSLFTYSTPPFYSYLHHYSPHFQSHVAATALIQAGYWGKGAMDPEPGRCRRTDGKKWRCSRDVVAGHKYCERHMHRGRNRSRKPVEFPAATSTSTTDALVGSLHKSSPTINFASGTGIADTQFSLSRSGTSSTLDAFQLNPSCKNSDKKTLLGPQPESSSATKDGDNSNNRVLMHFFDDYPRSGDTNGNMASSTSLSMSTPGNSSSDFLRLSTGNGDEVGPRGGHNENGNDDGERSHHVSWSAGGWGANPVGSMGGPLAEALRSSSNSSPTSVLHQLPRCSAPDTSFISV